MGVLEQKCSACGAMMRFEPKNQHLVCDYCGTTTLFDINALEQEAITQDFNFDEISNGFEDPEAESLPVYNCMSCGAELIAPAEQFAMTCPYCRNNIVLTEKVTGSLRPNGIIPFKFTAEELPARLQKYYANQKLLPKRFFSESRMTGVSGVYVPFWLFSGSLLGHATFIGQKSMILESGDYEETTTNFYEFENAISLKFNDLPVDASKRIEDAMMDSLEPFDLKEAKPFDIRYLAGFTADRFDTPAEDMKERARMRIENTADGMLSRSNRDYDRIRRVSGNLRTNLTAKYYLLPIYLFHMEFMGQDFPIAVNGQTGKIVGKVPDTRKAEQLWFFKRFAAVLGGLLSFCAVNYFLGG